MKNKHSLSLFANVVYGLSLVYLALGAWGGSAFFGLERWSLRYQAPDSIVESFINRLNYFPDSWPFFLAVAFFCTLMCLFGVLTALVRPIAYITSLMLYYCAYQEVDGAVTFLLYAQFLLFFYVPERKLQSRGRVWEWWRRWQVWLSENLSIIVPIGLSIFLLTWLGTFLAHEFLLKESMAAGLWFFKTGNSIEPFGFEIDIVLVAGIVAALARIWFRKWRKISLVIVFLAAICFLVLGIGFPAASILPVAACVGFRGKA